MYVCVWGGGGGGGGEEEIERGLDVCMCGAGRGCIDMGLAVKG